MFEKYCAFLVRFRIAVLVIMALITVFFITQIFPEFRIRFEIVVSNGNNCLVMLDSEIKFLNFAPGIHFRVRTISRRCISSVLDASTREEEEESIPESNASRITPNFFGFMVFSSCSYTAPGEARSKIVSVVGNDSCLRAGRNSMKFVSS